MAILIIGDGDFSFSKSLQKYINTKNDYQIISTCYESYNELIEKYSQAQSNIDFIRNNGGFIKTRVDGTKLREAQFDICFDLIIFNFPHRGGKSNIKKNRILLKEFFASIKDSEILKENGAISVSLCQGQAGTNIDINDRDFGNSWQIEEMASQSNYLLFDIRKFDLTPFGDYVPTGFRSQEKRFKLTESRTYIFIASNFFNDQTEEISIEKNQYMENYWKHVQNETINDILVKHVLSSLKTEELIVKNWRYIFDNQINNESFCFSPWQQIINIITEGNLGFSQILTHGTCFQTIDQTFEKYIIIIKSIIKSLNNFNKQCHCLQLEKYDEEILTKNGFEVTVVTKSENFGLPCFIANISRNNIDYETIIINTSQFFEEKFSICAADTFINLNNLKKHVSQCLDDIFPKTYYEITREIPYFLADQSEALRLLSQRRQLDIYPFRDMSFWLPQSGDTNIEEMMEKINEICCCVFKEHAYKKIELVDDYVNEESKRRSICIRMSLRSGFGTLSRAKINKLQSAVRKHCERILNVELR